MYISFENPVTYNRNKYDSDAEAFCDILKLKSAKYLFTDFNTSYFQIELRDEDCPEFFVLRTGLKILNKI